MGNVKKSLAERTRHKRQYDRMMNERQMQSRESKAVSSKAFDASLVVTECSGTKSDKHDTSSSLRTYITHAMDVDMRPVNDQVLFAEDAEQYQVKSPLLKAELVKSKEMIEKETYNELSRRFLLLEKHCISLEISIQHKEESFQSNKPCKNQDAPEFCEFFEINDLKAQLQAKTTLICNLKNQIKSVKDAKNEKLNKENEHLKQTYKELYDSIKKTRIQTKDHNDSLIAQVNSKTVENADLKAQIQEKIAIGQRFSPKKSSAVHEKPNTPRSCLRWKPTGRIFKIAGLRWIPTGKMFTNNTTKVDSEPPNGSNDDITNPYECDQTLNFKPWTSISSNDVGSHQFRPRSSMTNGVCRQLFRPHCSKKRK
ncbi:hypothetical protein Tco_1337468, partial [Tanacetum coccineum]